MKPTKEQIEMAAERADYCRDKDHCNHRPTHEPVFEWLQSEALCTMTAAYRAKCEELEAVTVASQYHACRILELEARIEKLRTALDEQHYYETDCSDRGFPTSCPTHHKTDDRTG